MWQEINILRHNRQRLTCVCALVDVEVGLLGEALVADVAGEGPVPHVRLLVLHQLPVRGQHLAAVVARVGRLAVVAVHRHRLLVRVCWGDR